MGRTYQLKNVIYFPSLNSIGGVETYCYEMGYKYGKDFDITVVYQGGSADMIAHISEVCRTIQFKPGDRIVCDVFIFGWGTDLLDFVDAKEYIQTYHADYTCRALNPCFDKRITKRFGVADNTTKGIAQHHNLEIETMYNPYTPKKVHKALNLISATRLTAEKGYNRMLKFASALDNAHVPFLWTIFTDHPRETGNKSMICLPGRYDILDFIAKADYLVQLSDTEGFSYSIVEALSVGTPVIVTPFAVAEEQGIINGVTGFILPFDMSNIPVRKIQNGLKKFTHEPKESHYEKVLSPGQSEYQKQLNEPVTVEVIRVYYDVQLQQQMARGNTFSVKRERAEFLEDNKLVKIIT